MDQSGNRTARIAKHSARGRRGSGRDPEAMALPSYVENVQARLEATGPVWSALANHHLARFGCLRYQRSRLYTRRPTARLTRLAMLHATY